MGERIGKILRIDMINIVMIDGPFVEEFGSMMRIGDRDIELNKPFVEEVERARESGKKERRKNKKREHSIYNR